MESTLQELSNGTKNTQIGVRMTKLWSYKVGPKTGKLLRRRDVRTNVATWQRAAKMTSRRCQMTSRRCCTTSRRSGLVLGGFLAHFEPIMEGFKAQTLGIEREGIGTIFLEVFEGEQAPFGWKHPRACSWRDF